MKPHDPDALAVVLGTAAQMARRLPPGWDGDRLTSWLIAPNGVKLGRMLWGRGLALEFDLSAARIYRPVPHVWDHSHLGRLAEGFWSLRQGLVLRPRSDSWYRTFPGKLFDPDRAAVAAADHVPLSPSVAAAKRLAAAITTYDGIINARANGKANDATMSKLTLTTVAQAFSSLWRQGGDPAAGTYTNIPGGAVHTRATTGAWRSLINPSGADKKYLLTLGFNSTSAIDWAIFVDLLVACGNINAAIATSQTINSVAQTRQYGSTLGAGVLATFEITTALGTGTGTFSLTSYTDQDGNTANVSDTGTSVASAITGRLIPTGGNGLIPWLGTATGDFGVRSVETFAFSAAHTAGVIALNLAFPLAYLPGIAANIYVERDSTVQIDGLTELDTDGTDIGALTWYLQTNSTTTGSFRAFARSCMG
jgi:hypothetical protein